MQKVTSHHNNVAGSSCFALVKLGGGTSCGMGGTHTAATGGPGGPNFAGDHVHVHGDRTTALNGNIWPPTDGGPATSKQARRLRNGFATC